MVGRYSGVGPGGRCLSSCSHRTLEYQTGESVVLVRRGASEPRFRPACFPSPLSSAARTATGLPQTVHYEPGRDYLLEAPGQIRRTPGSRIPDFGTNILYGKEDFRHDQFPGFGNGPFFVYVDYAHSEKWERPPAKPELGAARLPKTRQKLRAGQKVRMVAFGDSITAGGDASEPGLIFWQRWADALRRNIRAPASKQPTARRAATPPRRACSGCRKRCSRQKPDLVLIGFGMNDHNREGFGVPLEALRREPADDDRPDSGRDRRGDRAVLGFPAEPEMALRLAQHGGLRGRNRTRGPGESAAPLPTCITSG